MKGKPTKWSNEDIAYLTKHFPYTWNKVLAKHFNVGWRTIVRKARELNLEKAPDFRDTIDFTSFNKGIPPKNKGLPQAMFASPEGMEKQKQHYFKKGNVPANKLNPAIAKKIWNTRKYRQKEKTLKRFEHEQAQKMKHKSDRINQLKEELSYVHNSRMPGM
jgi:hypothetical protein